MSIALTFAAIILSIVLGLAVHHSKYTPKKLGRFQ